MTGSHRCGRKWSGLSQAHCGTCCRHFGSVRGFDRHRATGRCVDPATIRDQSGRPYFKAVVGPLGTTWSRDNPRGHYRSDGAAGIAIPDETEAA